MSMPAVVYIPGHSFTFRVNVRITVRDRSGRVLRETFTHNLITTAGLNQARDLLGGGNYCPSHIAVGDDATAPVLGDTVLGNEVFRKVLTQIDFDPGAKVQFTLFIDTSEANGNTLREGGLFNSQIPGQGDLFSRVLITPEIIKDASITVTVQWTITVARA